ncbi:MAG TPA: hypothetical protein V6C95_16115, partial [Coleofasciculaceae cyanobacterium]
MEYWQFLLQKEGDRSWKPIESPKIELEAGRYRVVAHSSRTDCDVEICVIHHSTGEVPPRRRSQKRSRRTNPEGLMVVIPYTYLKPGLWELRCGGDVMSDFLGKSWQYTVQVNVVPSAAEVSPTDAPTSYGVDSSQTSEPEDVNTEPTPSVEQVASTHFTSSNDSKPTVESTASTSLTSDSDPTPTVDPLPSPTQRASLTSPSANAEMRSHSDWGLKVGEPVPSNEERENDVAEDNLQANLDSNVLPYRPLTEIPSLQFPDPLEL